MPPLLLLLLHHCRRAALGQVTQGRPDGYVVTERDMKEATARALAALRGL